MITEEQRKIYDKLIEKEDQISERINKLVQKYYPNPIPIHNIFSNEEEKRKIIETLIYRLNQSVTETRKKIPKGEMYSLEEK